MARRRKVSPGLAAGLAALASAVVVMGAGIALADPASVQPGVTAVTPTTQHPPANDQPAQLHPAAPQNDSPAPRRHYTPKPSKTPAAPPPHEVHVGDLTAPVPSIVPDAVVDGVNRTNQDLENLIKPTPTPTPQPHR
ncbi:hypothetical protein [Nocardia macrotermitis]|uniref:Uncharacterized protein n=1 Tax=Nocardia macrotermitis TaxID=2585198 RepID=A0A7K0DDE1_9NOCA|nr:hypothetical protein [Nocardia macrotermitis]MQY23816.1 hypothetical protein [Nocardia macrotermitis]